MDIDKQTIQQKLQGLIKSLLQIYKSVRGEEAYNQLIAELKSEDEAVRNEAMESLASMLIDAEVRSIVTLMN